MNEKTNGNQSSVIEITYWVQRQPIQSAGERAPSGWLNVTKPDPRRGMVHKFARNMRRELDGQHLDGTRVRVCRLIVTADLEL